jgi:short-subunit dehydrogenase
MAMPHSVNSQTNKQRGIRHALLTTYQLSGQGDLMNTTAPTTPWIRALVTGASSGIGEAFARRLAADGVELVLVARRAELLHKLADELALAHGVGVEVLPADLTVPGERAGVETRLVDDDRPVELLVNNAGGGSRAGAIVHQSLDDLEAEITLNATQALRLSAAAAAAMARRGGGHILNVSSGVCFYPVPGGAVYAAAKAFVTSVSEALHVEVAGSGVVVTAVCPGYTRTEGPERTGMDLTKVPKVAWMEPDEVVDAALRGLRRKRAVVSPGAVNTMAAGLGRHLPRRLMRTLAARMTGVSRAAAST